MSVRRKHGEVREDGMVFWHYHPNGSEYWVDKIQYEAMQLRRTNRTKEYELANREKIAERIRVYRKLNPEKTTQVRQEFYRKNRAKILEKARAYFSANKTKRTEYKKRRTKVDPAFRLTLSLRSRLCQAFKKQGVDKTCSTFKLTGCSREQLKDHLVSQFKQGMTLDNYGRTTWHIDHIRPCSSFDLSDPAQAAACFHYSNLQPLFAEENLIKSDNY